MSKLVAYRFLCFSMPNAELASCTHASIIMLSMPADNSCQVCDTGG